MAEIIVELLGCLLFSVLTLLIGLSIVGSLFAALRAVGRGSAVNPEGEADLRFPG
jgi:hypothetical protein